jgi:carboxypeptidase PM20D1
LHPRKNIILPFLVFSPLVVCSQPHQHSPELSRLSRALQFQTVSTYDSAAFNPVPYKGFIDWLQESYPRVHRQLEWSVINEYSLVYHWKGSDPSLSPGLFLAHYDVVPVENPTKWARPAFSGHVDEHFIWGRGAVDNKSQVLALLESAEKLLQDGFIPRQTICFAFGHDEEIGGDQGAFPIERIAFRFCNG